MSLVCTTLLCILGEHLIGYEVLESEARKQDYTFFSAAIINPL